MSTRSALSNVHQSSAAPATAHFLASNKHVHVELKYVHVEVVKKLTVCQSYLCMRGVRPSPSCVQQDGAAVGMGQSGRVFASRLWQCAMQERAREQAAAGEHTSLVGSPLQLGRDLLCIARAGSGATAPR